jgi:hypothetical protein
MLLADLGLEGSLRSLTAGMTSETTAVRRDVRRRDPASGGRHASSASTASRRKRSPTRFATRGRAHVDVALAVRDQLPVSRSGRRLRLRSGRSSRPGARARQHGRARAGARRLLRGELDGPGTARPCGVEVPCARRAAPVARAVPQRRRRGASARVRRADDARDVAAVLLLERARARVRAGRRRCACARRERREHLDRGRREQYLVGGRATPGT